MNISEMGESCGMDASRSV